MSSDASQAVNEDESATGLSEKYKSLHRKYMGLLAKNTLMKKWLIRCENLLEVAVENLVDVYGYFSVVAFWRQKGQRLTRQEATRHEEVLDNSCSVFGTERVYSGQVTLYREDILESYFRNGFDRDEDEDTTTQVGEVS